LKQVKYIKEKIKLLEVTKQLLYELKDSSFRRGICTTLNSAKSYVGFRHRDYQLAHDELLEYISTALGPQAAYLEDWQRSTMRRRNFTNIAARKRGYLDRIQWVEWMIDQYKQIDKEQKAKK